MRSAANAAAGSQQCASLIPWRHGDGGRQGVGDGGGRSGHADTGPGMGAISGRRHEQMVEPAGRFEDRTVTAGGGEGGVHKRDTFQDFRSIARIGDADAPRRAAGVGAQRPHLAEIE